MHERYSIQVGDDSVIIYGTLSIEETFDFINFFEKKGFKSITSGYENSTIYMQKESIKQIEEKNDLSEHIILEKKFENLYDEEKLKSSDFMKRIKQLEELIKDLM